MSANFENSGDSSTTSDDSSTDSTSGDDPDAGQQNGSPQTRSTTGSEPQRRPPRRSDPMDRTADGNEPSETGGGDSGSSTSGGSGGSGNGGSRDGSTNDAPSSDPMSGSPEMQSPDGKTRSATESRSSSRSESAGPSTTEATAGTSGEASSTSGGGGASRATGPMATSPSGESAQPRSDPMDPNTGRSEPTGAETNASSDVNAEETTQQDSTTASTESGSGLEDYEPGVDPAVRDEAERLEDEFIEQTPGVDDESQVRVVWEDREEGTIRTELTDSGQKAYVEEQVKQETGLPKDSFNVIRTEDGSFEVQYLESEDPAEQNPSAGSGGVRDMGAKDDVASPVSRPGAGRSETRESPGSPGEMEMTAADSEATSPVSRPGAGEADTSPSRGSGGEQVMTAANAEEPGPTRETEEAQAEMNRALSGLGFESGGEDMQAPNAPDNATLAEEEAARSQENKAKVAKQVSEQTGQEYTSEDISVERTEDGQLEYNVDRRESFDYDWSFGYGDPEKDEVEQAVDSAAETYSAKTSSAANRLFSEDASGESLGAAALDAAGRDELAAKYDAGVRNVGRGLYTGAAAIGNVPALASGAMEGAEVAGAGISATSKGETGAYLGKTAKRGDAIKDRVVESAMENKAQTTGLAVGSLAASYGAMSAASRVGSRTGAATRYAIQPGEEIAGQVGHRATRAAAGQKAADRAFPNKEPLIFSEEAAIRAGKAGAQKVRGARSGGASHVAREAKALRFRMAERFRSDAPSRGTRDGFASRAAGRARQESVSARFRAAEASQKARDKASAARQRASEFASDDRGQAQVPRSRARGKQETSVGREEVTSPELDDASDTGFARSRARDSPMRGVEEPSISRSRVTGTELEAESELAGVTRSRARRVETNLESPAAQARSRLRAAQETRVEARTDELGAEMETTSPIEGTRGRTESRVDSRLRTELRTGLETRTDTRVGLETEAKLETETRSEVETKLEMRTELESRKEAERWDMRGDQSGDDDPLGLLEAEGTVVERDLINPLTGE